MLNNNSKDLEIASGKTNIVFINNEVCPYNFDWQQYKIYL